MTVSGGRSRRRLLSCIWVTPSEARAPLAMIRGRQPNWGRYLANLRERWTPAPPRGGKRYDRYNNERDNSTAPARMSGTAGPTKRAQRPHQAFLTGLPAGGDEVLKLCQRNG